MVNLLKQAQNYPTLMISKAQNLQFLSNFPIFFDDFEKKMREIVLCYNSVSFRGKS